MKDDMADIHLLLSTNKGCFSPVSQDLFFVSAKTMLLQHMKIYSSKITWGYLLLFFKVNPCYFKKYCINSSDYAMFSFKQKKMREQLLQNKRSSPHLYNLMSQYIASQAQLELNLSLSKFLLAKKLKTNEVRQLIWLLAKQEFSAQRILYLIREPKTATDNVFSRLVDHFSFTAEEI